MLIGGNLLFILHVVLLTTAACSAVDSVDALDQQECWHAVQGGLVAVYCWQGEDCSCTQSSIKSLWEGLPRTTASMCLLGSPVRHQSHIEIDYQLQSDKNSLCRYTTDLREGHWSYSCLSKRRWGVDELSCVVPKLMDGDNVFCELQFLNGEKTTLCLEKLVGSRDTCSVLAYSPFGREVLSTLEAGKILDAPISFVKFNGLDPDFFVKISDRLDVQVHPSVERWGHAFTVLVQKDGKVVTEHLLDNQSQVCMRHDCAQKSDSPEHLKSVTQEEGAVEETIAGLEHLLVSNTIPESRAGVQSVKGDLAWGAKYILSYDVAERYMSCDVLHPRGGFRLTWHFFANQLWLMCEHSIEHHMPVIPQMVKNFYIKPLGGSENCLRVRCCDFELSLECPGCDESLVSVYSPWGSKVYEYTLNFPLNAVLHKLLPNCVLSRALRLNYTDTPYYDRCNQRLYFPHKMWLAKFGGCPDYAQYLCKGNNPGGVTLHCGFVRFTIEGARFSFVPLEINAPSGGCLSSEQDPVCIADRGVMRMRWGDRLHLVVEKKEAGSAVHGRLDDDKQLYFFMPLMRPYGQDVTMWVMQYHQDFLNDTHCVKIDKFLVKDLAQVVDTVSAINIEIQKERHLLDYTGHLMHSEFFTVGVFKQFGLSDAIISAQTSYFKDRWHITFYWRRKWYALRMPERPDVFESAFDQNLMCLRFDVFCGGQKECIYVNQYNQDKGLIFSKNRVPLP